MEDIKRPSTKKKKEKTNIKSHRSLAEIFHIERIERRRWTKIQSYVLNSTKGCGLLVNKVGGEPWGIMFESQQHIILLELSLCSSVSDKVTKTITINHKRDKPEDHDLSQLQRYHQFGLEVDNTQLQNNRNR